MKRKIAIKAGSELFDENLGRWVVVESRGAGCDIYRCKETDEMDEDENLINWETSLLTGRELAHMAGVDYVIWEEEEGGEDIEEA